jgi:DNA repair exonuclease SbcCD ATPase subunit
MQLSTTARREIIEDLLDITVFSTMNEVLKDKTSEIKASINTLETSITIAKNKAEIQQQYITKLETDKQKAVDQLKGEVANVAIKINLIGNEIALHTNIIDTKVLLIDDYDDCTTKKQKLNILTTKLLDKVKKAKDEIDFYETNDNCPTCSQPLSSEIKTNNIEKQSGKVSEIEKAIEDASKQINDIEQRIGEIAVIQGEIAELQKTINDLNNDKLEP